MVTVADTADGFDHEAFVERLVRTMAMTTGPASHLNLISLVASGLMTWGPENKAPLSYEEARVEAAALVLRGVTGVMVAITELTLDGNGTPN